MGRETRLRELDGESDRRGRMEWMNARIGTSIYEVNLILLPPTTLCIQKLLFFCPKID